ncbi:hypothetical protein LJC46_05945 [Desulfovibrio sp. OttesenSCG-928-G15]|nr:hypothetical protein [Desulfovibrio sp. OttesenSCG-928-G15]
MKPKDFQKATINRICEIFAVGAQNKVLLADEVGLGKTIVARGVVEAMALKYNGMNAKPFRVVYICSNANIANQNAEKLGIPKEDCLKVSESRLSMQHLKVYEQQAKTRGGTQLIPLTPATSFSLTNGCGTQSERALIFALLDHLTDLKRVKGFSAFMRHYELRYWDHEVQSARSKCVDAGKQYFAEMGVALQGFDFSALKERIVELCGQKEAPRADKVATINALRTIFAKISLEKLEPDLVIMDEFQRFSELLNQKDSNESSMLFNKFIRSNGTKALLLSATPYKPYSTLGELCQGEIEHHEEFLDVISFLHDTPQKTASFKTIWHNYSQSLSELSIEGAAVLRTHKKHVRAAETSLYESICRTERFNSSIIDDSGAKEVPVSSADVLSYLEIQKYLRMCGVDEVPLDYVKSSPYLLSFMDRYKQKEALKRLGSKRRVWELPKYGTLLLKEGDIDKYRSIPPNNARLQHLGNLVFDRGKGGTGKNGMEQLLWLPPSRPYYSVVKGVFAKKKNLSKFLVFSSWEMVPRMLASMLSYEAERLVCAKLPKKKRYFVEDDKKRASTTRLRDDGDTLLNYPCAALAKLYDPQAHDGKSLTQVRKHVAGKVRECLHQCMKEHSLRKAKSSRGGAKNLALLLHFLDGEAKEPPSVIPFNTEKVLTDIALASPAVCAYRLLADRKLAGRIGVCFVSLFGKPDSTDILSTLGSKDKKAYYESALEYCAEGNLQAVLDEWAYVLNKSGKDLVELMEQAFLKSVTVQVDTLESFSDFKRKKKPRLRNHFAVGYFDARLEDKKVERAESIRVAFNSPLRPFVLATTSIGQEGLDFHLYCRKICHWNLPANPVDLEQREGRINRYQCLAIRQNIVARYADTARKNAVWEGMFQAASKKEKQGFSDLVPYWCLPNAAGPQVQIERIVPMYPFSKDVQVYKRLIQVLMLYRLTLGQPRQEELLENLDAAGLTLKDVQDLFFNLSPYWRASSSRPIWLTNLAQAESLSQIDT